MTDRHRRKSGFCQKVTRMSHMDRIGCRSILGLVLLVLTGAGCAAQSQLALPDPLNVPPLTSGAAASANLEDDSHAPPPQDQGPLVRGQEPSDGILGRYNPAKLLQSAKAAMGQGPSETAARQAFKQAEATFVEATKLQGKARKKRFYEAAQRYAKAAEKWPGSTLEEDALFMQAESYFFADRYPRASDAYGMLVRKYPNTRHMDVVDKRRFAMGKYWVDHDEADPDWVLTPNLFAKDRPVFDKFGNGVRVLDKIRFDDPTGKLADDATMAAAVAQFKKGNYMEADSLLTDLRRSFPNSDHQFQAHLLSVKCKLEVYQGPQYSIVPMDEAEALIKQIYRQFPDQAKEHDKYLKEAWKQVRLNKARHDWEMARYYDRRHQFGAARLYYDRVRSDYSDTSLASKASERLAQIGGEPLKPEQKLPWLAKLFPTPEREKPLVARNPLDKLQR